jgi:ABC-type methionine transport system ATPase subunit
LRAEEITVVKKLNLKIPANLINEPIIYKMVTQFNIVPNILTARLDKDSEGEVFIEIKGTPENVEKGIAYLKQIKIEIIEQ